MWPALIPLVGTLLEKFIPDPQAAADAKLKMLEMVQKGELAALDADMRLALGQLEVNKAEAAAPDIFTRSWRPFIGWVCGLGMAYQFIMRPILPWLAAVAGIDTPPMPPLELDTLMTLLFGVLGLGAYRTTEKIKGAA